MKRVHVVAAVIEQEGEILIARRPDHLHQGGKWEFPGGKVEPNERIEDALCRELEEELGIEPDRFESLITIAHDYPDKQVLLDVWRVTSFKHEAVGAEGQEIRWVSPQNLKEFEFPDANVPIVTASQLPRHYVITPELDVSIDGPVDGFCESFRCALEAGHRLFQLRLKKIMPDTVASQLVEALSALRQEYGAWILVNSDMDQSLQQQFDGVHLTSRQLHKVVSRKHYPNGWLAASCHTPDDVRQAEKIGVDFITLSPYRHTASHPDAAPIATESFAQWVRAAKLPVFALGGVGPDDLDALAALGAQGGAGISGYWPKRN